MIRFAWDLPADPVVEAPERELGRRARVELTVADGQIGYRAARGHALVPIRGCAIARPEVEAGISAMRAVLAAHPTLPADRVAIRSDGARVMFHLHSTAAWSAADRAAVAPLGAVALDGRALHGDPVLQIPVAGLRLRAGPSAFYQVDLALNERMVAAVIAAIVEIRAERVVDLYAGIGNLGLPVAATGCPVLAVESFASAVEDLRATVDAHGLRNVRALAIDARKFDPSREAFDAVILDPPRAGAGDVLVRALRNRPRRAVLLSCDPLAGARDVRAAKAAGYRVTSVRCFDLFPDTRHIEVLTVLDR
jgi:23S rRNA (uracil1939-C5)-methyltransferase